MGSNMKVATPAVKALLKPKVNTHVIGSVSHQFGGIALGVIPETSIIYLGRCSVPLASKLLNECYNWATKERNRRRKSEEHFTKALISSMSPPKGYAFHELEDGNFELSAKPRKFTESTPSESQALVQAAIDSHQCVEVKYLSEYEGLTSRDVHPTRINSRGFTAARGDSYRNYSWDKVKQITPLLEDPTIRSEQAIRITYSPDRYDSGFKMRFTVIEYKVTADGLTIVEERVGIRTRLSASLKKTWA